MLNNITTREQLDIVKITKAMIFHDGEPFATSILIAKHFGIRHDNLLQKIRGFHSFNRLIKSLKIQELKRTYKGQEYSYFELDADAFVFICMSFTGKKAETFKWMFIASYKKATAEVIVAKARAEANLANEKYFALRKKNKVAYKSFTDVIKQLCLYAEGQRGHSYNGKCQYYKLFPKMINKYLNIKVSKSHKYNKDILSPTELELIVLWEHRIENIILVCMNDGVYYKDIYYICKKELNPDTDLNHAVGDKL